MRKIGLKPDKIRNIGRRPERLAKIRNPKLYRERKIMSELSTMISSKLDEVQDEYAKNMDVVFIASNLAALVNQLAQQSVDAANSIESPEEKLAAVNQGLIAVVQAVNNVSNRANQNVLKFKYQSDLLNQLSAESAPEAEEPDAEEPDAEEEQEEADVEDQPDESEPVE